MTIRGLAQSRIVASLFATTLAFAVTSHGQVSAQCATCPSPVAVAAYQPVVAAPVRTPWYPGKLLGQWLSRPAASYASYAAPTSYTAAYAGCDPCGTTTYRPVSYAYYPRRLLRPAFTTVQYAPTTACCTDVCSSCTTYSPCSTCGGTMPCSTCATASYAAPSSGSCCTPSAVSGGTTTFGPDYGTPAGSDGNITPQPQIQQKPTGAQPSSEGAAGDDNSEANQAGYEGPDFPTTRSERDPVARRDRTEVRTAVYRHPITPRLAGTNPAPRKAAVSWKSVPRDR